MFELGQESSRLARLDPLGRVLGLAVASVLLAVLSHVWTALIGLLAAASLLAIARPPLGGVCRRLAAVNVFILFLWLVVPFSTLGQPVWSLGPLTMTRSGLDLALLTTIKANALVLLFMALLASMNPATLGQAMRGLGLPAKLVFIFLSSYRYIGLLYDEWLRLRTAARLRGFVPSTTWRGYQTIAAMYGMVMVRSFERAGRIYEAMLLRGFSGQFHSLDAFRFRPGDFAFVALLSGVFAGIFVLDKL